MTNWNLHTRNNCLAEQGALSNSIQLFHPKESSRLFLQRNRLFNSRREWRASLLLVVFSVTLHFGNVESSCLCSCNSWNETKSPRRSLWAGTPVRMWCKITSSPTSRTSLFHNYLVIGTGCPVNSTVFVLIFIWGRHTLHEALGEGDSSDRVISWFPRWERPGLFGSLFPKPTWKWLSRPLLHPLSFPAKFQGRLINWC